MEGMPGFAVLSDPCGGRCYAKASQVKSVGLKGNSVESGVTVIGFKSGGFIECLEDPEEAFSKLAEARKEDYAEAVQMAELYRSAVGAE